MSGYKRMISYVYKYEEGQRKDSIGFAKVLVRDSSWRISIQIKENTLPDMGTLSIYLFAEEGTSYRSAFLGEMQKVRGFLVWEDALSETGYEDGGILLQDSCGIWMENSGNLVAAAEWKEKPVNPGELLQSGQRDIVPELDEKTEEIAEEIEEESPGEMEPPMEKAMVEAQNIDLDSRQKKWDYLAGHFHAQEMLLGGGHVMECIRIGPRDLKRLPRDSWILGNNSFLLHGYYQYHHLLLCRLEGEKEVEYRLGVPGIWSEKERMMAELFGFGEFRRSGSPENRNGEFGYWFRKIEEA